MLKNGKFVLMVNPGILLIIPYVYNAIVSDVLDEYPHRKDVIDHLQAVKLLAISEQTDLVCPIQIYDLMRHQLTVIVIHFIQHIFFIEIPHFMKLYPGLLQLLLLAHLLDLNRYTKIQGQPCRLFLCSIFCGRGREAARSFLL